MVDQPVDRLVDRLVDRVVDRLVDRPGVSNGSISPVRGGALAELAPCRAAPNPEQGTTRLRGLLRRSIGWP
ncbi:MAG: hypothetical protein ACXV95_11190, partial [Acidimicrobiales bacterium]